MTETLRPWTAGTEGRKDVNGVTWFACDPYPTWYRWEDGEPFTNHPRAWADGKNNYGEEISA